MRRNVCLLRLGGPSTNSVINTDPLDLSLKQGLGKVHAPVGKSYFIQMLEEFDFFLKILI
jgi:hypothetical protein